MALGITDRVWSIGDLIDAAGGRADQTDADAHATSP